jgi:hypothetical protein
MKYESPITYHSKDMANVKVFADGQAKKLYAPDLSILRGHKNTQNSFDKSQNMGDPVITC